MATTNTQNSVFKYKDGTMLEFETRGRYSNGESSQDIRIVNIFYGTDGYVERFMDDGEANALLTRVYRPPYVVPDEV